MKTFKVISGATNEVETQLNELNKEHHVIITSSVVSGDTLICILLLNEKKV